MSEAGHVMTATAFGMFEWTGFVMSVVGIVLAIFAIWLGMQYKRDADTLNARTRDDLTSIRSDTKALTGAVMTELHRAMDELHLYGESMRGTIRGQRIEGSVTNLPAPSPTDIEVR